MTSYTRVTVQGEGRKADLVLPDDEPIAAVLPDVLSLLDEDTDRSSRPVVLMTTIGEQLSPALTLAEQDVEHGTILRLVRVDEAPPPPEVADVTDLMGEAVETRADRWRPVWGTIAAALLALAAGWLGATAALAAGVTLVQLVVALGIVAVLSAVAARRGAAAPGVVLLAAVVGAASMPAAYLVGVTGLAHTGATLLLWFALACVLIGAVGIVGFRDIGLCVGGAVGAALCALWVAMHLLGVQTVHVTAWVAILGVIVLGLLPGAAMTASGLTGLDDRVIEGDRVARAAVNRAVDATHRSLTWATVAAAIPTTIAAFLLARTDLPAAQGLAAAVSVIMLTRTQVLPLAPQRLALIAGGAVSLITLAFGALMTPNQAAMVAALLVVVLVVLVGARISDNVRARMRRYLTLVELLAVLALAPLALWLLDFYAGLIGRFLS